MEQNHIPQDEPGACGAKEKLRKQLHTILPCISILAIAALAITATALRQGIPWWLFALLMLALATSSTHLWMEQARSKRAATPPQQKPTPEKPLDPEILQANGLALEKAHDLEKRNGQLEQKIRELQDTQDQMVSQQKLAELGDITAGVAHEIRNPLQFIQNFAEASGDLTEQLSSIVPPDGSPMNEEEQSLYIETVRELVENMQYIRNHSARANLIVTRMQEAGRGSDQNFEERDINEFVRRCAQTACEMQEASRINLELEENFDPRTGQVRIMPSGLGQAIINITENALHAVRDRYREEEEYQPSIMLETRLRTGNAEVRIWDNGAGMKPEVIERALTPFFTTKPANQGSGLGLAIANDIVREHRGTLIVESEPGIYTVVTISIPAQDEMDDAALALTLEQRDEI